MAKAKKAKKATTAKKAVAKKISTAAPAAKVDEKILTVKFNKEDAVFEAYDANGKLYTAEDCPRQIMLQLALKAKQELYFAGKKWRRRTPATAAVKVQPIPAKADTTKVGA